MSSLRLSLPPQLLLLLLFLSALSLLLLFFAPPPILDPAMNALHLHRPASASHPHFYTPQPPSLHLFDPELNSWAFSRPPNYEPAEEEWDAKIEGMGTEHGGGRRRGGLGWGDLGMVVFVLVGMGLSLVLNERRRKKGVRGVKGRVVP